MCGMGNEDSEHFLMNYSQFNLMRTDLFGQLVDVPGLDITSTSMDSKDLCQLLLYGNIKLNVVENRMVIEATISMMNDPRDFASNSLQVIS